jgi:hypothetical protein
VNFGKKFIQRIEALTGKEIIAKVQLEMEEEEKQASINAR